ncbi:MAG TPA: outer membrane lipoprotein chaperone LolA [Gammaproteobacteria bacterium]|nr:outer membrane lipoprotein chaperone LolA [Gammaproteobacteria bacterium]
MYRNRTMLAALLALSAATAIAAPKASPADRLEQFLHNVHSLKADFTQTVTHATLPGAKKSHGTVLIKRPNRFRWNYVAPNKQIIDSDGNRIWIYDAELEQVTVKPLKTTLASSPAMLLSGQGSLRDAFEIAEQGTHDGLDWVTLKPKSDHAAFKKIRIGLGAKGIQIMELTGANLGQVTRIEFSNVSRNPNIPDSVFKFTPPKDADVIGAPDSSGR